MQELDLTALNKRKNDFCIFLHRARLNAGKVETTSHLVFAFDVTPP